MRAKKKLTKLWSILLVLVMVVGMLPTTALAAESATADFITNATTALALLNAAKTPGAADSTWDSDTNTLTLKGVNFTTSNGIAVKLPAGATIVLAAGTTNTITGGNSASEGCYGIYAEGSLTISGSGTLNVTGGNTTGTANGSRSCGIYTDQALTISGGTVKAYGGATYKASLGIYSKNNINISGTADVTAIGGTATADGSFGINAGGAVIISGGEVKATGGTGIGSDGLYSDNGDIQISGGKVTAIGGTVTKGWSVGIFAQNDNAHLQISDAADVTAIGGSTHDTSCGIYSANNVTISGGTVNAYGGTATYNSYGINSTNKVTFAGGTLTAATKGAYYINGTLNVGSGVKTISFDKNGGSGKMKAYTTNADSYTLPANGFAAPYGKQFEGWATRANGAVISDSTISVTGDTTLFAIWGDVYNITVTDGTASVGESTVSQAAENTTVTLTANAAPSGQVFDKWEVVSGDITLKNASSATTTFTMPAKAVSVRATYKAIYAVSVTYGTATPNGAQAAGTSVTIKADAAPDGKQFKEWTGADGLTFTVGSETTATATFTMPNRALTLIATYEDIPAATYTITFNANGGDPLTPASAVTGADGKLTSLPTPTRSGYTFKEWNTAANGSGAKVDTAYVFSTDTTIYAQWTSTGGGSYTPPSKPSVSVNGGGGKVTSDRNGTVTITPDEGYQIEKITVGGKEVEIPADGKLTSLKPSDKVVVTFTKIPMVTVEQFTDVAPGAWYYDAVKYAAERGLFYGTSDTTFSPNSTMTRGMLATVLYRMESEPEADPADFLDVGSGKYYSEAVAWAAANGIVAGYGNGNFGPEDAITREQLAAILWRYSGAPASSGTLTEFTDADKASGYALDALRWAVEQGIIKGKGNGILDPGGRATRAEVAAMLQRFCKKAGR